MKILLVDNDKLFLKLIKNLLLIKDYEIEEANNGYDGLQKAKDKHFDLVISNVFLQQISGLEFVSKYKSEVSGITPIYVISRSSNKSLENEVLKLGATSFLTIPLNLYKLIKKVNQLRTVMKNQTINEEVEKLPQYFTTG